jgi:hypothetical protein
MNFGPVSASTKANLESIEERHKTETETKISIQSQPYAFLNILFQLFKILILILLRPVKNPKTVKEMFEIIDEIDETIKEYKYFEKKIHQEGNNYFNQARNPAGERSALHGVPIRFILVPIKHLIKDKEAKEFKVKKRYRKISDKIFEKYSKMLQNILDFNVTNCVRNLIFNAFPESGNIILNKHSKISKEIQNFENGLIKTTNKYYPEAIEALKQYKSKEKEKITEDEINVPVHEINLKIAITNEYRPKARETLKQYKIKEITKENKKVQTGGTDGKIYIQEEGKDKTEENTKDVIEGKKQIDVPIHESKLGNLIEDFEKEFNIDGVKQKIDGFIEDCKKALNGVRFKDSIKEINNYRLFTDEDSLNEWYEEDRTTKILLYIVDSKKSENCKLLNFLFNYIK